MTDDLDRTTVVRRLHAAAAEGRLDLDETDRRLASARAATSASELDALVADLPSAPSSPLENAPVVLDPAGPSPLTDVEAYPAPQQVTGAQLPPRLGYDRDHPLLVDAGLSSDGRKGVWEVPPFLRVNGGLGSVKLNCLLARPAATVISIEVLSSLGTVVVVVPEGWAVNIDQVTKNIGTVKSTVAADPAPGCPLLVVTGGVGMGTFKARYANRFERWRARKAQDARLEIMR